MRRDIGVVLTLGVALGIAVVAIPGADARWWKSKVPIQPVVRAASFCVSGEYTGRLEGWITLNGGRFLVSPSATICEVGGGGVLPVGTMLTAQRVTLSGIISGDAQIVQLVTVRPFRGGGSYVVDESRNVGVLDGSQPQ
jgi:hypothetical protein